jgi:hypothetical protein
MKDVGKFYGHLVYFTAISYILWPFGIFYGHFGTYISPHFGMLYQEKSGAFPTISEFTITTPASQ